MKVETKKCKSVKKLGVIEFGEVFRSGDDYYIATDDTLLNGGDCDTLYCVNIKTGDLEMFAVDDMFEVVKAKVVIE